MDKNEEAKPRMCIMCYSDYFQSGDYCEHCAKAIYTLTETGLNSSEAGRALKSLIQIGWHKPKTEGIGIQFPLLEQLANKFRGGPDFSDLKDAIEKLRELHPPVLGIDHGIDHLMDRINMKGGQVIIIGKSLPGMTMGLSEPPELMHLKEVKSTPMRDIREELISHIHELEPYEKNIECITPKPYDRKHFPKFNNSNNHKKKRK